jgi:ribonuclease HII
VICGVDEAGKGSVLGPMVIAAVGADSEEILSDLPVKDSKLLSPKKRESLCQEIIRLCRVATVILPADMIDEHRKSISMNGCVAQAHAEAIRKIRPETAYVDACDVNPERYSRMVQSHLRTPCRIISEHRADQTYRIVSAASIVAKVVRDREIARLADDFGPIGSGYPSDPETIAFLSSYIEEHRRPPSCARKSWKTVSLLMARHSQSRLF